MDIKRGDLAALLTLKKSMIENNPKDSKTKNSNISKNDNNSNYNKVTNIPKDKSTHKTAKMIVHDDCPAPFICRTCTDKLLKNAHTSTQVLPYWFCNRHKMPCECAKSRCMMTARF